MLSCRALDDLGLAYPRPLLQRESWWSLNGPWDFALDREGAWSYPSDVHFDRRITVPYAPESAASGIGDTSFYRACWYRRSVTRPACDRQQRLLLHFGACDYRARVWVNGLPVGEHEGRIHAVLLRHHAFRRPPRGVRPGRVRGGRPARPREAARQTGLAARAAFDLVPAHDRHLADGLARGGARHSDRQRPLDAQPGAVGDRAGGEGRR